MFFRSLFLGMGLATTLIAGPHPKGAQVAADSSNAFAADLIKPMMKDEPNSIFSPFSLFSSLSMVASGAQSSTFISMKQALRWSGTSESMARSMQILQKQLSIPSPESDCTLKLINANGLFAQMDTTFLPAFQKLVDQEYDADLQSIDFSQEVQATQTINTWVANTTQNKIPRLLNDGDVDAATRLALVNAIYFSGRWEQPFSQKKTTEQSFQVNRDVRAKVNMMNQIGTFSYLEQSSAQILSLPFDSCGNTEFSPALLIVLPSTIDDFVDVQKSLTPSRLQQWLKGLKPTLVDIQLPKFCLRRRQDMENPLKTLGMREPFSPKADFSGIDGMKDLFLSKVIHEAYFDLNESGVEAAAATAAMISVTSAAPSKQKPISFTANHPFLFLLVDRISGVILFIGKLSDPSLAGCD